MIYTVRTANGQESLVPTFSRETQKEGLEIYSITIMPDMKGYAD